MRDQNDLNDWNPIKRYASPQKHTTRESDRLHNHSTIKYKTMIRVDQGLGKLVPYTVPLSIRQAHFSYLLSKKGDFSSEKLESNS